MIKLFEQEFEKITSNHLINQILWFNGIKTKEEYLNLQQSSFPYFFNKTSFFIDKIDYYLKNNKKIIIIGDYDCDGICATSILTKFLNYIGISNDYLIGSRFEDGYGINKKLIDKALFLKGDVIITVDNGVKAVEAIDYALSKELDVIITDHHEIDPSKVPNAMIFNHHLENFECKEICGATTILILVFSYFLNKKISNKELMFELYELAALATIADVMPLYNFNRKLVMHLIKDINTRKIYNKGIKALCDTLNLSSVTAKDISFQIVPIINAPGRIDNVKWAVDLFLENNIQNAIKNCLSINEKRKSDTKYALELIPETNDKINVFYLENISEGIIGILAGHICSATKKPTFIFTNCQDGFKGSARSTDSFDVLETTLSCLPKNTISCGGHKEALGLTLASYEDFLEFKEKINQKEVAEPILYVLDYKYNSFMETYETFSQLEPLGKGLDIPLFYIQGTPHNLRLLKEKHTSFHLTYKNEDLSFICFNKIINKENNFLFEIKKEVFNGMVSYKGFIKDAF